MPNCCVSCCKKQSGVNTFEKGGITYHFFPKDPELRNIWKLFCNNKRTWVPTRTSVICSSHFRTSDFNQVAKNKRNLKEYAVPRFIPECVCGSHPLPTIPSYYENATTVDNETTSNSITQDTSSSQQESDPLSILPSFDENSTVAPNNVSSETDSNLIMQDTSSSQQQLTVPVHISSLKPSLKILSFHGSSNPRERKMQIKIDKQTLKIKRLHARINYMTKKFETYKEVLQYVDEQKLLEKKEKLILERVSVEERELIQRQLKNCVGKPFSPELKRFALTLYSYSPKAYKYVRKTFGSVLPHPRTLPKW